MLLCYPSLRLAALRARTVCHVRPKCLEGRKSTITSKVHVFNGRVPARGATKPQPNSRWAWFGWRRNSRRPGVRVVKQLIGACGRRGWSMCTEPLGAGARWAGRVRDTNVGKRGTCTREPKQAKREHLAKPMPSGLRLTTRSGLVRRVRRNSREPLDAWTTASRLAHGSSASPFRAA